MIFKVPKHLHCTPLLKFVKIPTFLLIKRKNEEKPHPTCLDTIFYVLRLLDTMCTRSATIPKLFRYLLSLKESFFFVLQLKITI